MMLLNTIHLMPQKRPGIGNVYKFLTANIRLIHFLLILTTLAYSVLLVILYVLDDDEDIDLRYEWGSFAFFITGIIHM